MVKKRLLLLLILAALASVVFIVFSSREPVLTITIEPKDATVLIDGKKIDGAQKGVRVARGNHEIQAVKEGYYPYLQTMTVDGNASQAIILIPRQNGASQEPSAVLNVPSYSAGAFQPISSDTLIAINNNNSFLIKISKSGISTLYAKPVYSYSFVNPYVALIERGDLNKIAVINIETNQIITFDAKDISPVISISLNPDLKNMFLLGKHNPATRATVLYSNPLNKFLPEEKGSFFADSVQSLSGGSAILSLSADAANLSKFSVFDLVNSKYLYETKGNGALVSPYYENMAVYSTDNIAVVSLSSYIQKVYPFSSENQKIFWKTQNILGVLTNTFPGAKISFIDTQSGSQTSNIEVPQLNQVSVRFVLGYFENTLYLQDADGKIWSINPP